MEEISRKRKIRGGHKGYVTRLTATIENENDEAALESLKNQLEEKKIILKQLDDEILELVSKEDDEEGSGCATEINNAGKFLQMIEASIAKIKTKLKMIQQPPVLQYAPISYQRQESVLSADSLNTNSSFNVKKVRAKLPKLELKKFSGRPIDWPEFWDGFQTAVHENEELSNVDKFSYLRHYLEEPAKKVISGFSLTEKNYATALKLLEQRYAKPTSIKRAHINELLNASPVYNERNIGRLRELLDFIETHYRGLEAMGVDEDSYATIVVPVLLDKIPEAVKLNMIRSTDCRQEWTLGEMLRAFGDEVEVREQHTSFFKGSSNSASVKERQEWKPRGNHGKTTTTSALLTKQNGGGQNSKLMNCVFCNGLHDAKECTEVKTAEERKKIIFKQGRCLLCLKRGHRGYECRSKVYCSVCSGRHHLSICDNNILLREVSARDSTAPLSVGSQANATSCVGNVEYGGRAVLQTALAIVREEDRTVKARVLFYSGSHKTFVTLKVKDELCLEPCRRERLGIKTFGSTNVDEKVRDVVRMQLESVEGKKAGIIEAYVVENISEIHNEHIEVIKKDFKHLNKLWFSDVCKSKEVLEIDILIGIDFLHTLQDGQTIWGEPGEPVAVKTKLGWVLSGPLKSKKVSSVENVNINFVIDSQSLHTNTHNISLDKEVQKMWDLETIGISKVDDVYEDFLDNVRHTGERYTVKLPWKVGHKPIPTNYSVSLFRLKSQIYRLKSMPEVLESYDQIMKEQLKQGIIEEVSELETSTKTSYLPHQAVIRQEAETTKLRIVYDASAKEGKHGISLNDCLHVGPPLTPLLFDILVRFRENKIGMVADIEKAFLNVEVDPHDRDCFRFLWTNDIHAKDLSVNVYRFRRLIFGANCSPFLLNAVLRYHIAKYEEIDPQIAAKLAMSFYVDDLVCGAHDIEGCRKLYSSAKEHMKKAGFNLRKWKTSDHTLAKELDNDENLLEGNSVSATEETYAKETLGSEAGGGKTKVLGLLWDMENDNLEFDFAKVTILDAKTKVTKRTILSTIAKLFDPLGLVSPIIVGLKILFQKLCTMKIGWDEEIPTEQKVTFEKHNSDLHEVNKISLPRCLYDKQADTITSCSLHGFGDASKNAYCAMIYLVCTTETSIFSKLICTKTRVAPLKELSIPRLELMSACILSKLMATVYKALSTQVKIDECRYWLDSKTALYWINNQGLWKQFVQHRVNEILQLSKKENWGHCAGICNPADIGSRGVSASMLVSSRLWWEGPHWLVMGEQHWPTELTLSDSQEIGDERKKETTVLPVAIEPEIGIGKVIDLERYSTIHKLYRVTSYVIRFVRNLRLSIEERQTNCLTTTEILEAESFWIKDVQRSMRQTDKFRLLSLQLGVVEENGIMICKGRLGNSDLEIGTKFPMLLPREDRFTDLIIEDCHNRVGHLGLKATLAEVRTKFWVPRGRQYVKRVLNKCRTCIRLQGRPYGNPIEAPLPDFRVKDVPAFTNVGVDFAGPLYYKEQNGDLKKCYIVIYTCCTSRALHLDLVNDLSGPVFLRSLRRLTARRGTPSLINSDNAKTFKFAAKFLDSLSKDPSVFSFLQEKRIKWKFNLERSPWWGGYFERLVGSVKSCLKKVIGNARLLFDELYTVLLEVEGILNSRPLTYVYDEISYEPLTPNHLIYGRRLSQLASNLEFDDDLINENATAYTKRFWYIVRKINHFALRWKNEYLVDLREFHRSRATGKVHIQEGDVVLVKEDNLKRNQWKMGLIEDLIRGKDGIVRGATVRLCSKGKRELLSRPIQKLFPLELRMERKENGEVGEMKGIVERNETEPRVRTQRAAAKDAGWKTRLMLDS